MLSHLSLKQQQSALSKDHSTLLASEKAHTPSLTCIAALLRFQADKTVRIEALYNFSHLLDWGKPSAITHNWSILLYHR